MTKKKVDITKIKTENIARIGNVLNSPYRKKILDVLLKQGNPLKITEIQLKCNIPNYKNAHENVKMLHESGFVNLVLYKKSKYAKGAQVSTNPQMILEAIFVPIKEEMRSIQNLFDEYKKNLEVPKALDKINERFGDFTLFYGPTIEASNLADDTVGFGRTRERKGWKEA